MKLGNHIFDERLRPSTKKRAKKSEDFYSDHSRIVFSSSFRRMMQKAQVFSLESNTSVRNRLAHSLEVADVGKTLARHIGQLLEKKGIANSEDTECVQTIVENACLIHDIGNPPFGHFGEEAIKKWFKEKASGIFKKVCGELPLKEEPASLFDFYNFDGNPQGFRIVTRLHSEIDNFGLNLTKSTLLASIKYPACGKINSDSPFHKKIGIFDSERDIYKTLCDSCGMDQGKRYFLSYIVELADDICYCMSDIADSFEKGITTSREFKDEFKKICKDSNLEDMGIIPPEKIDHFGIQISINMSQKIIDEASDYYVENIEEYLAGTAKEITESIDSGKALKCFKTFAKRFIYKAQEAQRIEIAGSRVVEGLFDHYGILLEIPKSDFIDFYKKGELRKGSDLDIEWRIFNQLSERMLDVYDQQSRSSNDTQEWICRAHLITDYIAGMTDNYALADYQNVMGISL